MTDDSSRVAVVTGGGGGLGRAIALRLAADGYALAITDLDEAGLKTTGNLLHQSGARFVALQGDIAAPETVAELFERAEQLGQVTAAVNNAAIYPTSRFVDTPLEEHDRVMAVNERAYWMVAQAGARRMVQGPGGSIVNVSSITIHGAFENLASYVTSKAAVIGLTHALARELGPSGVRVNAVAPGAFPTAAESIHRDHEAYNASVIQHQALKRRGDPAELAAAVSFLLGPDASFVTGQTIIVDGGWFMT